MNSALRSFLPLLMLGAALCAQEPSVAVNGKPIVAAVPAVRIGDEEFLPLGPIARALGADIVIGNDQTVRVRLADGASLTYDGRTGEIRSGAVLAGEIKTYRLVKIAADPDRLLFPLSGIVALLGVRVRYDGQANILNLESVAGGAGAPRSNGFSMTDLAYQYGFTSNGSVVGQNVNLHGVALAGATTLTAQLQAARVPNGPPVYLNQVSFRAGFPGGRSIAVGDQPVYTGVDALMNSMRGFGYEQSLGGFKADLYAGEAIGSVSGEFGASMPHYDTELAGFSLARSGRTSSLSLGLNAFRNPQRRGATFGLGFGQHNALNQLNIQTAAGFFSGKSLHTVPLDELKTQAGLVPATVNGIPVPGDTAAATSFEMPAASYIPVHGPGYGVSASDAFFPVRQVTVSGQVEYYSANFLTAREDSRFNGSSAATISVSIHPFRLLTLNGSSGNREFVLGDPRRTRTYTYGATFLFPGTHSPQAGVSRTTQSDLLSGRFEIDQYSLLLPGWGRYSGSLFYTQTILGTVRMTDLNGVGSAEFHRYGRLSLHYQSQFGSNQRYGGDWYLKLGKKDGYLRLGTDHMRMYSGRAGILPLIGVRLPLPGRHILEVSYLRDISTQMLQVQLGGKLMQPHEILRDSRGVPRINARTTIAGQVYVDCNYNGVFDAGDRAVADTVVWLDGNTATRTDAHGTYRFDNLDPGAHRLRADISGIPAGYVFLGSGETTVGAVPNRDNRADFPVIRTGQIEGRVTYLDYSDRGNPHEAPLPDVRVVATRDLDTYTESNGAFLLGDLAPGRYEIRLDPATLPSGYVPQPSTYTVVVEPGVTARQPRFKLVIPPKPVIELRAPDQKIGLSPGDKTTPKQRDPR